MLNRYNFASSSFEFSTFLSSRNAKKNCMQSSFPSFALKWGYSAGLSGLLCLQRVNLMGGFIFQKQCYKKIGLSFKPDEAIMMSSNVHK